MNGTIFNIQKFCVNDGPGIRTNVFMKGCPLQCIWCHNPESQTINGEIIFYREKCAVCGRCIPLCPLSCHSIADGKHIFDRTHCIKCGACTETYCGTLEKVGKKISSDEVIAEVLKDKVFYENSGGGMTLSGGEPLFQFDFALELLKKAKENGLHTAMETCGFTTAERIRRIAEYTDLFLFDYKETDSRLHKEFTAVDNALIINNLEVLDNMKKDIILRCPIIPGYNDRQDHFDGICRTANRLKSVLHVELEPYHSFGGSKYSSLGRTERTIAMPSDSEKYSWLAAISKKTDKEVKFA